MTNCFGCGKPIDLSKPLQEHLDGGCRSPVFGWRNTPTQAEVLELWRERDEARSQSDAEVK